MKNMISNILDISRMEENKLNLRSEPVDLSSLIKKVTDSMRIIARQEQKSIILQVARNIPLVNADKDMIVRVIFNLLGNALKFTPKASVAIDE